MVDQSPAAPLRRPRAPTITVDTSAVSEQHAPEVSSPSTFNSGDPNSLVVPIRQSRARGDSVDSQLTHSSHSSRTFVENPSSPIHGSSNVSTTSGMGEDDVDLSTEEIPDNPFAFTPSQLQKLLDPKNLGVFQALGGPVGLQTGLRTDLVAGLSIDEQTLDGKISFEQAKSAADDTETPRPEPGVGRTDTAQTQRTTRDRKSYVDRERIFGENRLPERKSKSIWALAWIALQDKVLILLSIAAVVSLALGLYQTFGTTHEQGAKVEWVEGVAIIVAITIVVFVGAVNDWQKERQFVKLNRKKEDRMVKAVRSGKSQKISIYDVQVGDVLLLEQGDIIPVDGIFIGGHNVSCDESSATGESDLMKKTAASDVFEAIKKGQSTRKMDPFILSGAKVADGFGTFVVTAVGQTSTYGRTMMALRDDNEVTPLQFKLNVLAGYIAKLGSAAGLLLFGVLLIEFLARLPHNHGTAQQKAQQFLRILITAITIIVVAVPEGLPLAVTLALAFATKRMTKDNNLVRHLQSCETMGNATVICSDKTGTLTQNVMTVVAGTIGAGNLYFGEADKLPKRAAGKTSESVEVTSPVESVDSPNSASSPAHGAGIEVSLAGLPDRLNAELREILKQSIAVNTTAFEGVENGKAAFIGTKTETALLEWAQKYLGLGELSTERSNAPLKQLFPFDSGKKCMGAVVSIGAGRYRMYIKGAPEILLDHCSTIVDDPVEKISVKALQDNHKKDLKGTIMQYAKLSLRTMAIAYRDFDDWPPAGAAQENSDADFNRVFNSLTWLGVVGIQDPVREGVAKAVGDCQRAGVNVKMVTGDNIETARAIAKECGILTENGLVMQGPDFRRLGRPEMEDAVKKLCVLARSSPEDKRILVKTLISLGEVVAVTGDGTNDAPALKAADVGFSMGITGTEVAKEASDIILMDDNFASIVKALAWGRTVNDAVKKFLQFQITVNITAVVLTFVSAVSSESESSVLNAVQLLWVNLIMDTFAALALATDPPSGSLLDRKPEPKHSPLINLTMWKMIVGQSIFQLIVTFVLYFAGPHFLHYPERQQNTLVFNVFVWMQIFNAINSRRIDNSWNVFEGLHRNFLFMAIMLIMIGGQVLIVFVGGAAFVVEKLTGAQWGISLVIGVLSLPIGALIRLIPDSWIRMCIDKFVPAFMKKRRPEVHDPEGQYDLGRALLEIKDDLAYLRRIRGGRINQIKQAVRNPREFIQRSRSGSRISNSPMHSALGIPGLLAGTIGGLSPIERPESFRDQQHLSPPPSSAGRGPGHA
ncbi:calcium-translocating P-type ATPase [Trichodelitschia bisporula]|uniref:Calcium-transporting ATPase n=1 Tax=Trichodelitschia bisporula TaxID=703511 RepID=A0A6G1HL22_9PEZI|nr:calcium-translocating P-type ATPase [Trichodelitschia bisporula]